MPQSKEIQEQMRNKIVDMYQSEKGYKAISRALGLQRTTVRAIIHTGRKPVTVVNLPRSGRPTKITSSILRFCTIMLAYVSENPVRECPAISLWPQAQAHLGYAAGQWSQTHQHVHLWMAQEKLN